MKTKSGKTRKKLMKARKKAQSRIFVLRRKIDSNAKPHAIESVARSIIKEANKVERLTKSLLKT
jgi:hypothetical protein